MDAVGFTENAYNGIGASITARSAGVGIKNGILAKYDGVFWFPLTDNTQVLDNTFSTWRGTKSQLNGVSIDGLVYDGCQGGDVFITSSSNFCAAKNMRLAISSETAAGIIGGVPSCGSWTWTTTLYSNGYYVWLGSSVNVGAGYVNLGTRCVR